MGPTPLPSLSHLVYPSLHWWQVSGRGEPHAWVPPLGRFSPGGAGQSPLLLTGVG